MRGVDLLDGFAPNGTDDDYRDLQKNMDEVATKVSDSAWGHKYFSLLYPEKLDDYHSADFQRYHLIKLLQVPPEGAGRYLVSGRYVAAAKEMGVPIRNLTQILNERDGDVHHYWRVGTSDGTKPRNRWQLMRDGGFAAIGWPELGDLSGHSPNQSSREAIKLLMAEKYPGDPKLTGKKGEEVFRFVARIRERDLILAADGQTILGVGRVVGGYTYDRTSDFPHRRPVEWLNLEEWKLPSPEGLQTTVYHLTKHLQNLVIKRKAHLR